MILSLLSNPYLSKFRKYLFKKALLPVGNVPLIDLQLEFLKINKFKKVIVFTSHYKNELE